MFQKIIKIIEKVFIGILIALICILGYYIIKRLISKDQPAKLFGYYLFEVSSWSMYKEGDPKSIAKGDLVFVKKNKNNDYQVGMVITYTSEKSSMPITHQIVEINGNKITTRGINEEGNTTNDEPFDVSQVLGEVKKVWHNYNGFMKWMTSPIGIICIILIGFIIVESFHLFDKSLEKRKKEKNE